MKFWGRSGSQSAPPVQRRSSSSSLTSSTRNGNNGVLSKKIAAVSPSSSSIPTRKQRMQLLKCIIHHADAVQKQYLVQKQLPSTSLANKTSSTSMVSMDSMKSMIIRPDTVTAEINDKCYQRWHQVLQEGLVPMSVHALNLLEKTATSTASTINDEEETYFATMEGMEEEIQVMCILARAAAVNDTSVSHGGEGSAVGVAEDDKKKSNGDGMEQINDMMKCTAMLLFHIVLASSTPGASPSGYVEEDTTKASGYDGRVRHVIKLACVDVLTKAIVEGVESFDNNTATDEEQSSLEGPFDMDDYSLWNIANIKTFLDQTDLGKDAIFGTPFKPSSSSGKTEAAGGKKLLLEAGQKEEDEKKKQTKKEEGQSSQSDTEDEQTVNSEDSLRQTESETNGRDKSVSEELPLKNLDSIASSDSSSSSEIQSEQVDDQEAQSLEGNSEKDDGGDIDEKECVKSNEGNEIDVQESSSNDDGECVVQNEKADDVDDGSSGKEEQQKVGQDDEEEESDAVKELRARRQFNAKFLATRKFELIERLVAIDIVRFLMAEDREKKLREKEQKEHKGKILSSLLKKGEENPRDTNSNNDEDIAAEDNGDSSPLFGDDNEEEPNDSSAFLPKERKEEEVGLSDPKEDAEDASNSEELTKSGSQYFTASRVKKIKRGAKVAGVGLAIGTVFAITGGLAAPALAAGIGGVAALTGASTASSAAVLAVLATFKAGAALFGVGGGGLAAYRMKKRTAGLSQFEVRRENIEQNMYEGASEEKMKKGIETMLPQLHTAVVVSGWLRNNDVADFQLAWGIQPTCKYADEYDDERRIRQMKRFYAIHNPPLVHLCESFMMTLQRKLKKDFSWDRIWSSLEHKYGVNPDHILPMDEPHENEVFLSYEEREMIDGVLNTAKVANLRKRGYGVGDGIDFDENCEISELLSKVSPKKTPRKNTSGSEIEQELGSNEDELVTAMQNDLSLNNGGEDSDEKKTEPVVKEIEMVKGTSFSNRTSDDDGSQTSDNTSTLQERMAKQRDQQVSFLKSKGLIDNESDLKEGAGSPKMAGSDSAHTRDSAQDPPANNEEEEEEEEEYEDERTPIVWDWTRLYGTTDIHTVTWDGKMLSSLCHIVENMALEVSSQATKVALQYSVIGAIISAVAIPSALITASKLIDDPYQIVVIRADEAGKELAKCLLQSDERRPVTLVGFSFGARVVYSCLRELARQQDIWEENRAAASNNTGEENKSSKSSFLSKKKKDEGKKFQYDREPASLVGDVIFIGLPRAIDKKVLTSCRRVTGGRLVNCYTRNDWLLSLMFVARGGTPCGTRAIEGVPGVENYDVTNMVESHTKYGDAVPYILQHVRFSEP
mmetsp:Transcript_26915/g.56828  ORF Transcript_26915/g.56828 Transcript_26915/m.56828 type:complete len:1346 (-) Transcript_26915:42-4079(-)